MSVTPMNVTPMSVTSARSAAAEGPLLPKRYFAMRRVLLCALPLLVLVLWIVALATLANGFVQDLKLDFALPATPVEPMSWSSQGDGSEEGGGLLFGLFEPRAAAWTWRAR